MGMTRANLTLTNMLSHARIEISALVDTGAMHMCVTALQARELGFDPEECITVMVTMADGRRIEVPRIRPIEIAFANRTYASEAFVLGDEALIGVVPIEAMDLVIDLRSQRLSVNPEHPDFPVFHVKRQACGTGPSGEGRQHLLTTLHVDPHA